MHGHHVCQRVIDAETKDVENSEGCETGLYSGKEQDKDSHRVCRQQKTSQTITVRLRYEGEEAIDLHLWVEILRKLCADW